MSKKRRLQFSSKPEKKEEKHFFCAHSVHTQLTRVFTFGFAFRFDRKYYHNILPNLTTLVVMGKKEKRAAEDTVEEQSPSKKKSKKSEDTDADETINDGSATAALADLPYNDKLAYVSIIAQPMASKKLAKKLFKLIKKASKQKNFLRAGLRDVQMRIRKGETGLCIFAGDVTPVEVMCHLPAVCEDRGIPYGYVLFRQDIAAAMGVRRPCLMALVRKHADYDELYQECEAGLKTLPIPTN